ncbi:hypothetical protein AVEN_30396-1 [Araneus ventricosus]|uniref:Integrase zinc-binding domain-containing protein n=1 Tax=Araneus ventricosus TaxID=182803 RepID=A0A4Y2VSG2_ARAVE|nr:hypothetical protein AVEN_30396-1 [Araneus ventricosus]
MKTLSKTRERFYWDRFRADVEKWCRECHDCGAREGPKTRTKGHLQRYNMGEPFERMALDILGPFPVTTKGNRYVLVYSGEFTLTGREFYRGRYGMTGSSQTWAPDLGDEMWDLKNAGTFSISLLGTEIRIYPDDTS